MNSFVLNMASDLTKFDYYMFFCIAFISAVLMCFVGYKLLQILQLTGYKLTGFCIWFVETKFSYFVRLFMLTFLSLASMLMTNVLLADFFVVSAFKYLPVLFFVFLSSFFITNLFAVNQKTPLKYTKRMNRFTILFFVLNFACCLGLEFLGYLYVPYLSFTLIGFVPILLPVTTLLAYFISYPFEKIIAKTYINRSKNKLKTLKNIKIIGITGSYGKTTLKNILATILSVKLKTKASPSSFNTPLGLSKTILNDLCDDDEIFIAEMGAKQRFDIKELCDMVEPDIGIITGVGNQHLSTFGSVENVISTKAELGDYVSQSGGKLFICTESENSKILAKRFNNFVSVDLKNKGKIYIDNICVGTNGSTFDLHINSKKKTVSTCLLGEHNISNILLAVFVANELGLSVDEICTGIEQVKPILHRLQLIDNNGGFTILDDAYNCSVESSRASLEVLSKFSGKKIVITPGLVELGKEQFNANFEFGKNMASVADYVLIDSLFNFDAISSGLVFAGFDESKIIKTVNLSMAIEKLNQIATKDDVVLFENDLPDNFN